jgi:hypothetical protein
MVQRMTVEQVDDSDDQAQKNGGDQLKDVKVPPKWDIPFLHFFINPSKKHAVGYLFAVTVAAVAGFFLQEGLNKIKDYFYPDPKIEKLEKIQASSDAITSTVDEIKAKLNSAEPLNATALFAKLDFIAQQNSNLLPLAQGLANANTGYVRGAKVMRGPFEGVGSFYMDLNHGQSAGMAQVCGNATVTYEPVQKKFRMDHQGRSDIQYLSGPGALRLHGISVVVHSAFDSNGSLQLTYDCGNKA